MQKRSSYLLVRLVICLLSSVVLVGAAGAGSLYSEDSYRALSMDHRAKQIGDSLTVLVYEAATATNSASTRTNKSASLGVTATDNHNSIGGALSNTSDSEGGGVEKRSGELIARISATVVDKLDTGELVIKGDQRISLNSEAQSIRVEGRVRPSDIDANNTVISTRISDARIEFVGQGLLSAREKPGVFTRIFHWLF